MRKIVMISAVAVIAIAVVILSWSRWKALFYVGHMESDSRIARMDVTAIVNNLSIRPGDTIADIGAGSGLFTRAISLRAAPGIVYAVDINKDLLGHVDKSCRDVGITNVITVLASEDDPLIPVPVDLIFICDTLHYIQDQPGYIMKMATYLKPGGRIAVIDFKNNWPPLSVRFTEEQLIDWMSRARCRPVMSHDGIRDEFFKIFAVK